MFETAITDLLNKHLRQYFTNFNPSQVKAGVLNGELSFINLQLQSSAFDSLCLPLDISHGYASKLEIFIPWYYFNNKKFDLCLFSVVYIFAS